MVRNIRFTLAAAILAASIVNAATTVAAAWQPAVEGPAEAEPAGPLEEVIVRAPRSLKSLREAIFDAEDRAFDLYNELNTDDDYDIVCHREAPTGSRISYRNCRARFVDRLLAENTAEAFSLGGDGFAVLPLPMHQIEERMQILSEKIESLAREHPQLLEATVEVQRRKDAYQAAQEARE
jgi:hypothetical protein